MIPLVAGLGRRLDLTLHHARVGHGVPALAQPIARLVDRLVGKQFEARELNRTQAEAAAVRAQFAGRQLELVVSRWPQGFSAAAALVPVTMTPLVSSIRCLSAPVSVGLLRDMALYLRTRGLAAVRDLSIAQILAVLDKASRRWLDPNYGPRALAVEAIHRVTGFAREMVIRSIDLEMRSSLAFDLGRTLWTELGNVRVLDGRHRAPTGESPSVAFGPALLAAVFSSNIPGLPHLTYMRALAVKAPVLAKVASFEPVFAGLYVDTLLELCPQLGPALAAVWFKGGSRDLERALLENADAVVAYGSDSAIAGLGPLIPPQARRVMHAHRMGFGLLTAEALAQDRNDLAARVAYDFAMFDGQACLTPVVYLIEGDLSEGARFAQQVGAELGRFQRWVPRRQLAAAAGAARHAVAARWEAHAAFAPAVSRIVRPPRGVSWMGLVTGGDFEPQPVGDRLFHIHCVPGIDRALEQLAPYAAHFQNVGLGASGPRRRQLAVDLATLGASRVNEPGRMPTPSMMWHHDGRMCLSDLLRWADLS
jgi:hypothetical protein